MTQSKSKAHLNTGEDEPKTEYRYGFSWTDSKGKKQYKVFTFDTYAKVVTHKKLLNAQIFQK